jgi:hypothetical protein
MRDKSSKKRSAGRPERLQPAASATFGGDPYHDWFPAESRLISGIPRRGRPDDGKPENPGAQA